ncbi:MAG: flagellar M-ring protein FliF C-terminal domain-containing protein, partial [Candidatus Eremiobacterota bacterium]
MATGIHSRISTTRSGPASPRQAPVTRLLQLWWKLSPRARLGLVTGLCVALIALMGWEVHRSFNAPRGLYTFAISPLELREMSVQLTRLGIEHELNPQKDNLLVGPADRDRALAWLQHCGLPRKKRDYEPPQRGAFPAAGDSDTETAELCERLRVDLRELEGVADASVQLTLPDSNSFLPRESQPKSVACVMVTLQPGYSLGAEQARAIRSMVSSAVKGLAAEDVEVVDTRGRTAGSAEDAEGGLQGELRRGVEERMTLRAQQFLNRVFGEGKAFAAVTAELDFAEIEIRRKDVAGPEHYVVVQSKKESERYQRGQEPGEAQQLSAKKDGDYERIGEISKNDYDEGYMVKVDRMPRVQRVSCAVVVDRSVVVEPRQVRDLMTAAVGLDESRGD